MEKKMLIIGICVLVLLAVFSSGCFEEDEEEKEEEEEEEAQDIDGDGVPDSEDDFPSNGQWSAILEVTKINWSTNENRGTTTYWEFKNNKSYSINVMKGTITLFYDDSTTFSWGKEIWKNGILGSGEKGVANGYIYTVEEKNVSYAEVEVKGKKGGGNYSRPDVEIESEEFTGEWVYAYIKNNEAVDVNIEIGVAYFNAKGELLETSEPGSLDTIGPGETKRFGKMTGKEGVTTFNVHIIWGPY